MLRRIGYVSRARINPPAVVPEGLSDIVIRGRRSNKSNGITGFLSYDQGVYIQFIEGEHEAVGALFARIRQDRRHDEVAVFVDESCTGRAFESSALKLSEASALDADFRQLVERCWSELSARPAALRKRIQVFHDPTRVSRSGVTSRVPREGELINHEYRLTAFPSISRRTLMTSELLELFARLKKGWLGFDAVVSQCEQAGISARALLLELEAKGVVQARPVSAQSGPQRIPDGPRPEAGSFYQALRNFFRRKSQ